MLRISLQTQDPVVHRLLLEGRLTAATAAPLEDECRRVSRLGGRIVIDLSGLRFVDEPGARMLVGLRRGGVVLEGGSGFVRELLQEVSS